MRFTYTDCEYRFIHGKAPKGCGMWWFKCGGYEVGVFGKYGEAKREAARKLKELGVNGGTIVVLS